MSEAYFIKASIAFTALQMVYILYKFFHDDVRNKLFWTYVCLNVCKLITLSMEHDIQGSGGTRYFRFMLGMKTLTVAIYIFVTFQYLLNGETGRENMDLALFVLRCCFSAWELRDIYMLATAHSNHSPLVTKGETT